MNLSNWRKGGYEDWRRAQQKKELQKRLDVQWHEFLDGLSVALLDTTKDRSRFAHVEKTGRSDHAQSNPSDLLSDWCLGSFSLRSMRLLRCGSSGKMEIDGHKN